MMFRLKPVLVCFGICALAVYSVNGYSEVTARLWKQYCEAKESGAEPELADFSYVGYHCGDRPIPTVDWKVFDVADFGARPNDGQLDRGAIRAAISAAEKHGSGVIAFSAGRFLVSEEGDESATPIVIGSSRIVLRGAGAEEGGTEIFMQRHLDATDPNKMWSSPYMIQFRGQRPSGKKLPVVANARRETHAIEVDDATSLKVGDWVVLHLLNRSPEVVAAALKPYSADPAWTKIIEQGVAVDEFHRIESIEGSRIVFREPIHVEVQVSEGWTIQKCNPLEEVGVEGIAFTGNWKERFKHHKNAIHDGGWSVLSLSRCVNSWVRDCRFTDVNRVLGVTLSSGVTVQDIRIEGNPGHNAITLSHTSHSLVQRVDDRAGHWHASGVAGKSSGNVFLRCEYTADTCYESHASQPRWTLFDNIRGGWKYGRWGGAESSLPNHLHGLVFWNYCNTGAGEPGDFHFMRPNSIHGRTIMPYVIGFHGNPQDWATEELQHLESNGAPVWPESLYEAQRAQRSESERPLVR